VFISVISTGKSVNTNSAVYMFVNTNSAVYMFVNTNSAVYMFVNTNSAVYMFVWDSLNKVLFFPGTIMNIDNIGQEKPTCI